MNEKGFSLMELILVTLLMGMVLAGLAAFQGTLVQQRGRLIQEIMVQNQADIARKKILAELSEATAIASPLDLVGGIATSANDLQGYKNVYLDPATNTYKTIDASVGMRFFRFCVNGGKLYYYWGKNAIIPPYTSPSTFPDFTITCGGGGTTTGSPVILAGGPTASFFVTYTPAAPNTRVFQRPRNNYIQVFLRVAFEAVQDAKDKARFGAAAKIYGDVNTGASLPLATR